MPRRPASSKPAEIAPPGESKLREYNVLLHRIVEQSATYRVSARSDHEAEEIINGFIEDRKPNFLSALEWKDGEVEMNESVVLVQEAASGSTVADIPFADSDSD